MILVYALPILGLFFFLKLLFFPRSGTSFARFPGPKELPFFGSVLSLPLRGAALSFKLLTDEHGPICQTNLFGLRVLVVSSEQIAKDLLVSNGKSFSGRPNTPAVKDAQSNFSTSEYLPLMSFNEDHHRHKKIGTRIMTKSQARNHLNLPTLEAGRLMLRFLENTPEATDKWVRQTEGYTSRVLSTLCFGSATHADRLHALTWELLIWVSPSGVLPNLLPFLSGLPFYLSPWKMVEWYRHRNQQTWFKGLLEDTRSRWGNGEASPSFMLDHLEEVAAAMTSGSTAGDKASQSSTYPSDDDAARAIGMIATAGIFTVSGPLQNIVRALVCFPQWQDKVRQEMDEVVGSQRVPTLDDLPRLPLLRGFIRETTRWRQAIPAGVPHENDVSHEYNGIVIEKGTAIFAHEYGMSRDPNVYKNPYDFDPMRWLDPSSPNYQEPTDRYPTVIGTPMFGWGRRYCMGHELARDEIYAFASHIVWAYKLMTPDLEKLDRNLLPGEKRGGYQWPKSWQQDLIIMKPEPVKVLFQVRDEKRAKLLHEVYAD